MSPTLVYVADPMCSWCWGFREARIEIERALRDDVSVRYVMGGLAPDSDEDMPPSVRGYVQSAWDAVERATGATFNREFWTACRPRRSTYVACRAVIAAREQATGAGPLMFDAIQRAYYLEARNPSDADVLIAIAQSLELDADRFARDLGSEETRARLDQDLALRDRVGVTAFPSLAVETEGGTQLVMRGCAPAAEVLPRLAAARLLAAR